MGLQSGMIEFEVDSTQLQRIELKLKDMKAKAPQALKNAVNATARDAKKDLAAKAKETYTVKAPKFKQAIKQKNATAAKPTAILKITGKPQEASNFKTKANAGSAAAKIQVLKSSSLKEIISTRTGNKAFVVSFTKGGKNHDVQNKKAHNSIMQRRGKARLPIKTFYSPSDPIMVENEAKVYGVVRPTIEQNLKKNIQKQIDKILGGK